MRTTRLYSCIALTLYELWSRLFNYIFLFQKNKNRKLFCFLSEVRRGFWLFTWNHVVNIRLGLQICYTFFFYLGENFICFFFHYSKIKSALWIIYLHSFNCSLSNYYVADIIITTAITIAIIILYHHHQFIIIHKNYELSPLSYDLIYYDNDILFIIKISDWIKSLISMCVSVCECIVPTNNGFFTKWN
jgi:hypothetical protein